MKTLFISVLLFVSVRSATHSQTNSNFNVNLQLDLSAADQTIQLFEDKLINTKALSELRGNRIAASTTGVITNRGMGAEHLQSCLDSLKYHQIIRDDVYRLETARKNAVQIKELLNEIKKSNFNRRVVATVEQIFPQDAAVSVMIPVYVVAIGHENVDAYVRRIIWHGDVPQFTGEGEGKLTIVINLAQSVNYGPDLQERFVSLLGVVAHEVFHAAFGAYKEHASRWKKYYATYQRPFDNLLDLAQNEGVAYYLSLDQRGHGYVPRDWETKIHEAFSTFNRNAAELLSENLTPERASELIRMANLSGYWESYGAMTGMFIAREIDLRMGRAALIETVAGDPFDFFNTYRTLCNRDSNLPKLAPKIIAEIQAK
jgi:hypothetical protein